MQINAKEHRYQVCMDIARCFYENGMSFNISSNLPFIYMVRSIGNYGRGLKPPSRNEAGNWMLNEEVMTTSWDASVIKIKLHIRS
ncbi:hypothetical protein Ccrd_024511 [Cynara cardunculus var. scolymus]|uniref:Uncharacterized protein n=1 Tax=Cynara cardunculus var. scolymus TaxID=59895 RepID=A0A103XCB7_CYNCS|nr:hypothetical protein Ccrd_024511 [Cynara cardunculus var. scolymus]